MIKSLVNWFRRLRNPDGWLKFFDGKKNYYYDLIEVGEKLASNRDWEKNLSELADVNRLIELWSPRALQDEKVKEEILTLNARSVVAMSNLIKVLRAVLELPTADEGGPTAYQLTKLFLDIIKGLNKLDYRHAFLSYLLARQAQSQPSLQEKKD